MTFLMCWLVVGHSLDIAGRLIRLSGDTLPARTRGNEAANLALNTATLVAILLVWYR